MKRNENSIIPVAIQRELSCNNKKSYLRKLDDRNFLNYTIEVCEECYFLVNDTNLLTKSDINAKIRQTQMHNKIVLDHNSS